MGFEPTIPLLEQEKTFYTLDCAAPVIGSFKIQRDNLTHSFHRKLSP
jgi:hypothetical protein